MTTLQEFVQDKAAELEVPGAVAGVVVDGQEHVAHTGITSVENPLPVDAGTLFQFGSTGKTFTATAVLRLVDRGLVALDAPVRRYLPDLVLRDEQAAENVTVLQLLNHTAGWEGDKIIDTGDGDDALAIYVRGMADLQQVSPLGTDVSYNNASLSLAGHLVARVLDTTFEKAVQDLLLDPLGLSMTFFRPADIISRRFVVGHTRHDDGRITVARPWAMPRSAAPAGGMSATLADQLTWARFHLGDGTAADGTRVLPAELLALMQQPTVATPGSALGDAVGISWLLKDLDGQVQVSHGGTTNGQHSDFSLVPGRAFAVTSMTNCGPNGPQLNHAITAWAMEHFLGLTAQTLVATPRSADALAPFAGVYETVAMTVELTVLDGGLLATAQMKPETRAQLTEAGEDTDVDSPPIPLGLVEGGDQYVVTGGPAAGMRGYFTRDAGGRVDGVHLGGRLATRVRSTT